MHVQCQQAKSQKQVKRIKISNIARYVVPFVSAVMLLALATSSVFLLVRARKRCGSPGLCIQSTYITILRQWFMTCFEH
jgi:hypothetical protein